MTFHRLLFGIFFAGLVLAGAFYIVKPQLIQNVVSRRVARTGERGGAAVRHRAYRWFVRFVGVTMVVVGLRGLYLIGLIRR
jgi:hypothetical protein